MRCIDNLHVCVDCGAYIAYSDLPENKEAADAVLAGIVKEAGDWVLADDSQDLEFSWRPCDCCGSRLGGFRYGAAVLYPDEVA